jgi:RNA polymerase sigma-70 factor (ECF subfamily)
MSYFREVNVGGTFPQFGTFQAFFGFVPNVFWAQTLLPRVIEAEAGIARAVLLEDRGLSRIQKGSISLTASVAYGSEYWVAGYYQMLRSQGVPDSTLNEIVINHHRADLPISDKALLDFTRKLATRAPWLSGGDIAELRRHQINDESILEAVMVTGLTSLFCTLSAGLGPFCDFELKAIPRFGKMPPAAVGAYVGGTGGPYVLTVERSPESFPPFAFFLNRFGFIPNVFRAQTLRPDVIEAEAAAVREVLQPEDFLSRSQKEYILLVSSAANLNTYCVAAHCEMLRRMGLTAEESDQIALDHHQADLSEGDMALLDFILKLTARPAEFSRDDVDRLRRSGFTEEHILEAVAVTALNSFFNTLQMGLGTTPDTIPKRVFGPEDAHRAAAGEHLPERAQEDPDAELVAKAQSGDLDAFEELVTRHSRRVFRALVGIVGNVEEARDAMQDTFLKAFQHISTFQRRSKFSTWLLTIANNTGLQRLRDREPVESLDNAGDGTEADFFPRQVRTWADNPEQLYSAAERRRFVEQGMLRLPAKYRVVLVLRDIEQLSTEEAATALGLGVAAIKSRLCRARLMLRETLAPHFIVSSQSELTRIGL